MTTPSKADELRPARIAMNLYARMSDCGNPDCIDTNMCADCEQSLGLLGDYVTNLITTTLTQEREALEKALPTPPTPDPANGDYLKGYATGFVDCRDQVTAIIKGEK